MQLGEHIRNLLSSGPARFCTRLTRVGRAALLAAIYGGSSLEPVTVIGGLLAALPGVATKFGLDKFISDTVVGEARRQLVQAIKGEVEARLKVRRGLAENHDIAQSVRKAHLDAVEYLVERFGRARSANPHPAFLSAMKAGLSAARETPLAWDEQIEAAVLGSFDRAFLPPTPAEAVVTPHAVAAAWSEVSAWAGGSAIPEAFEAAFHGRLPGAISWFEAFAACVAEEMKTNGRFRDAFFAGRLMETSDGIVEGQAVWRRIEETTFELRADIASLRAEMHGRFDRTDGKIADVATDVSAILAMVSSLAGRQADAAGLSATQVIGLIIDNVAQGLQPDDIEAKLAVAPGQLMQLRQSLQRLTNDDPRIVALRTQADAALADGRFDEAGALLLRAAEIDVAAVMELETAGKARRLGASASFSQAAKAAKLGGRLRDAAHQYGRAAEMAEPVDPEAAWRGRIAQAAALSDDGTIFGRLDSLSAALAVLTERCLALAPRDHSADDWANTQNRRGNVLWVLGERQGGEAGTQALVQAVQAYDLALEVRTLKDARSDWAATQNNRGIALSVLGERQGGEAGAPDLAQAVQAYDLALEVRTRKDAPSQWAMTTVNLAMAEAAMFDISGEVATLKRAIARLDEAISVYEGMRAGFYIETAKRNREDMVRRLGKP